MKSPHLRIAIGTAVILIFFTGVFSAAFFITSTLYQNIGRQPPAFVAQLINSLLGLVLSYLFLMCLAYGFRARHRLRLHPAKLFGPIIEALERIAKGDFNVRLDADFRENKLVGELAESVNAMALELSQMERLRQEFISDISHEIQSPLTSIRGFAQALHGDHLSPEVRDHYLAIIETESTRLSRLADNLLRLAALEAEQPRFEPAPYRLDRQITDLILACEPQWGGKEIDMDVSMEEVTITADEDLLSQVWANLIHNSIKFTPAGGKISVHLCRQAGKVEFKIADTGIGISEEDQARVFERFYKADKARQCSKGGSGLGLAIVKKIVEMHQGTIELESKSDAGATFTVSLPAELP
jgi:two-component system phosphate regulon sensor histidine kinase PhoR